MHYHDESHAPGVRRGPNQHTDAQKGLSALRCGDSFARVFGSAASPCFLRSSFFFGSSPLYAEYGTDEWCRQMRTLSSAQRV